VFIESTIWVMMMSSNVGASFLPWDPTAPSEPCVLYIPRIDRKTTGSVKIVASYTMKMKSKSTFYGSYDSRFFARLSLLGIITQSHLTGLGEDWLSFSLVIIPLSIQHVMLEHKQNVEAYCKKTQSQFSEVSEDTGSII